MHLVSWYVKEALLRETFPLSLMQGNSALRTQCLVSLLDHIGTLEAAVAVRWDYILKDESRRQPTSNSFESPSPRAKPCKAGS